MNKIKKYIVRFVLIVFILFWMNMVFGFSAQNADESSNLSLWVASIFTENEATQMVLEPYIRKVAHFSEYGMGGLLFFSFFATFKIKEEKQIIFSVLLGSIYAITDEVHQIFIDGRSGQIKDVFIDTLGAITGSLVMCLIIKIFKEKILKKKGDK